MGWPIIFVSSFYLFPTHWAEPVIRLYILLIHYAAKYSQGTFFTSSVMLLFCIWIILLDKNKYWIIICLFLHAELAHAPATYWQGPSTPVVLESGRR